MEEFFCSRFYIICRSLIELNFFLFYFAEDNLRQLHGIQESIQRMRQVSVQTLRLQVYSWQSSPSQQDLLFSSHRPLIETFIHPSARPFITFFLFLALRAEMGGKNNLMDDGGR
jgi:hypothetical protein